MLVGLTVMMLVSSSVAMAGDETPAWGNFEIRYGSFELEDDSVNSVYGEAASNVLFLEAGPQIFRFLELDVGIGRLSSKSFTVDGDTEESAEATRFQVWPFSLSATARLHIFDEQWLVPFAQWGVDYVMWNERWDDGGGDIQTMSGAKMGQHMAIGGNLLLDPLGAQRASLLESQTGINDTFIVVEWRRQTVDDGQGLNLSGDSLTVGLKLDY